MSTPDDTAPLPDRGVLDSRIETQRLRLFQAHGTVVCIARMLEEAGDPIDGHISSDDAEAANQALEGAMNLLDEIAGELDPAVILKPGEED
jgi:hypothetical protein